MYYATLGDSILSKLAHLRQKGRVFLFTLRESRALNIPPSEPAPCLKHRRQWSTNVGVLLYNSHSRLPQSTHQTPG